MPLQRLVINLLKENLSLGNESLTNLPDEIYGCLFVPDFCFCHATLFPSEAIERKKKNKFV